MSQISLSIGDVSKRSGLPASTLRYYEEKGLIKPIGRRGLTRLFDDTTLQRLGLIALGRLAGFSLDDIASMLTKQGANIDRHQLEDKAEELDKRITQLTHMRNGLRHAANCSAPSHLQCPKFLRLVKLAGKQQKRHRR